LPVVVLDADFGGLELVARFSDELGCGPPDASPTVCSP
jgi:hypothetical protein